MRGLVAARVWYDMTRHDTQRMWRQIDLNTPTRPESLHGRTPLTPATMRAPGMFTVGVPCFLANLAFAR